MNTGRFHSKSLVPIMLCWLFLTGLNAQGFVQHFPLTTWFDGGTQSVFPQANGTFRLTATSYPDLGTDISLFWWDVNAGGQLISTASATTSILEGPTLFLLDNGDYLSASNDSNIVSVSRFQPDGSLVWSNSRTFPGYQSATVMAIRPNDDGGIFVRGSLWFADSATVLDSGFVMKFSPAGNLFWQRVHAMDLTYVLPHSLEPTPDGGCLFANYAYDFPSGNSGEAIVRFSSNGALLWSFSPANGNLSPFMLDHSLSVNALGESLVPVRINDNTNGTDSLLLVKLSANGQPLTQTNITAITGMMNLNAKLAYPTADGGWILEAEHPLLNSWKQYVLRLNAAGTVVWYKPLNFFTDGYPAEFTDGQELGDGSLLLYGRQANEAFLLKLAADGTIYPHTLIGQVARDSTFDCLIGPNDPPLPNRIVVAEGNGHTQFATTDAAGHYAIPDLDTGTYLIHLGPQNYLWQPCQDSVLHTFSGFLAQTDTLDFPVQPLYDCPVMQIDLGVGALRRCLPSIYTASYCNVGNQTADPAIVTMALDPLILVDSASIPFTQTGDSLRFVLGPVAPGECGSFQIRVTLSCAAELGQTLCTEAHISPDAICVSALPDWSGAAIKVTAVCIGDSVRFSILNTGFAPTATTLNFIVIDDHVITREGNFSLQPNQLYSDTDPADGSTWRLVAQQEPGFPFGPQMPSVAVEGCNASGSGFSPGMLNLFPNYSGDPFEDIECRTVVGSYDPNDKQAFPVGVESPHYIEQNQALDYQIRFQNTGTDTAFTVVVKDTLSAWLDPASVRPGAGSHPYSWTLSGTGILIFTFDHILLPDSNVNEPASHGFIQFHIDQRKDLPLETVIENRAGIYFDFNAPVLTNTVWHTVGHNFLSTAIREPEAGLPTLQVWPNPTEQATTVWASRSFENGQRLVLRDALGRVVQQVAVQGASAELRRKNWPAGLYFLELRDARRVLARGKVVWK